MYLEIDDPGKAFMNVKDYIILKSSNIVNVMKKIDKGTRGIVFVCDENSILSGVISDGDIRRFLISHGDINANADDIANHNPIFSYVATKEVYRKLMKQHGITALPILDSKHTLIHIEFFNELPIITKQVFLDIPVVIMAGGKGSRLRPYTQIMPKPLIPVGDKTILEHIMDRFEKYGCKHFDIIINFKKNLIKSYFFENEKIYDINFIEEKDFLGTAGGLRLVQGKYKQTFFMTNCDILVEGNYEQILKKHKRDGNIITLVCAKKKMIIPYGVVTTGMENNVVSFKEKPEYSFLTNTGLYVMEPEILDMIPDNTFIHITDIIKQCIMRKEKVGVFDIDENDWLDMGQLEELERMKSKMGLL